jgi:phosphogluconate dehydratase
LAPIAEVTGRIRKRSAASRGRYLERLGDHARRPRRGGLSCTNLAHGFAAAPANDKLVLRTIRAPNLAIVSAYNDMLSAHQPLAEFPDWIKAAAREAGATAQFAGGVPAMCDGVTQGQAGMELSLFSRDVIAMATAVALSHDMFDAALYLGVCDKIVPGLLIGALHFGHLPALFVPAGPMSTGLSNAEKSAIRQRHAAGELGREALLESESRAYHGPGTCTFYGTANSNQMLMEALGLHLPGAAFVPPHTPLREALTREAARRAVAISAQGERYTPVGRMIDERSIVNAMVVLLATGGSTNHTLHLVAIAGAAGIVIDWDDFAALSAHVPLLARIYPNGQADVNAFHALGGTAFVIRELLASGHLHGDVDTVMGRGLEHYAQVPELRAGRLAWAPAPVQSADRSIVRGAEAPFSSEGGLKLLQGNLGRAVIKVSAVEASQRVVEAPARVFDDQQAVLEACRCGDLNRDVVVVVRFQGPRANGMPELHKLTPALANLQDRGHRVALVTDGRMSGASGKVAAALHLSPEAAAGGPLARVRDGDVIRLDAEQGTLEVRVPAGALADRPAASFDVERSAHGLGRELFRNFREHVSGAEQGAVSF